VSSIRNLVYYICIRESLVDHSIPHVYVLLPRDIYLIYYWFMNLYNNLLCVHVNRISISLFWNLDFKTRIRNCKNVSFYVNNIIFTSVQYNDIIQIFSMTLHHSIFRHSILQTSEWSSSGVVPMRSNYTFPKFMKMFTFQ